MSAQTYDYSLINAKKTDSKLASLITSAKQFRVFLKGEWGRVALGIGAVSINTTSNVLTPFLIAYGIDNYIAKGDLGGLTWILLTLGGLYFLSVFAGYLQPRIIGHVSQRTLFQLRGTLFDKLQSLPARFFQVNKAGDIISRVNNDTDKLNSFLSQSIFQFMSSFFSFLGVGIFILFLNWQLGAIVWLAIIFVIIATQVLSPIVSRANTASLTANGDLTSQASEDLANFKAVVAFNKQTYFNTKFQEINNKNFRSAFLAQTLNSLFNPVYNLAGNIAQVIVLMVGINMVAGGTLTIGLLIGFVSYTQKFYEPLRILGAVWGTLQEALSAWTRVSAVLSMENDLVVKKN